MTGVQTCALPICTDEVVIGYIEQLPRIDVTLRGLVGPILGLDTVFDGGLLHFQAVFVGPREEHNLLTAQPLPAGKRIGGDGCVGMPDVRDVVDVIDRSCDVRQMRRCSIGGYRRVDRLFHGLDRTELSEVHEDIFCGRAPESHLTTDNTRADG